MRPVLILLAAVRLATAADANFVGYFPPDTKVVIGFRVRALVDSGFFQEAASALPANLLPGFDLLKDLDEVLIGTSGEGEKPPAIAVLRGRFNLVPLARGAVLYHDVPILEIASQPGGALALIDETTAIAGEIELVRAAIDRRGQGGGAMSRIDKLRERYSIWGFGDGLPTVEHFEFGAAFQHGLEVTAEIRPRTTQDAEQLTSTVKLLQAMMKGSAKKSPKGSAFDMRVQDGTLKLTVSISEEELKKAIREQQGSLAAAFSAGMPSLRPVPAPRLSTPRLPAPPVPVKTEGKTITNSNGDTVIVTLPGGH